jgi:hypothetical protein
MSDFVRGIVGIGVGALMLFCGDAMAGNTRGLAQRGGRAQIVNPVSAALRAQLRHARYGCRRHRNPAACARMRALYAERRRILRAHRASLRQRGLLPAKPASTRRYR